MFHEDGLGLFVDFRNGQQSFNDLGETVSRFLVALLVNVETNMMNGVALLVFYG